MKIRMMLLCGFVAVTGVLADETLKGECDVEFFVSGNMRNRFSGTVQTEPFDVTLSESKNGTQTLRWKVDVDPNGMSTNKKKRDKEMHKMFRIPEYSFISGEVKGVELDTLKTGDTHPEQFVFEMTIIGATQEMAATATNWREDDQGMSFDTEFIVSMSDFGLKPKKLMKFIHVYDDVPVKATFRFRRGP